MNRTDPTGLFDIPGWVPVVGGMCVDIADPSCVTPAEGQPNDVGNFASGVLSFNPITGTMDAFGLIDTGKYADTCSGWYTAGQVTMAAIDIGIPVGAGRSLFSRAGLDVGPSLRGGTRAVRGHFDDAAHRMADGRLIGPHFQLDTFIRGGARNNHRSWRWEVPGWFPWP